MLLLEPLDFPLVLGTKTFKLLLLFHGEHWLFIGILGCLPPPLDLLRLQTPLAVVGTELGGVEPSGLEHHRELVGGALPSGSFSEAGTTSPCSRQVFLQL